jgi:hypothetical protein
MASESICISCQASKDNYQYQDELIEKAQGYQKILLQLGIPFFFYISGVGVQFYNTQKKGFLIFAKNKLSRLLLPLLYAIPFFLIPRLYLAQDFQAFTRPDGSNIESNIFTFFKKSFATLITKLSWLWFLPALFLSMIFNYPLLAWS